MSTLHAVLRFCVAFVDLKAAFDRVDRNHGLLYTSKYIEVLDRNALWKAMRGIGVPSVGLLMDVIIDLHTATSARVRLHVAGRLSTPFITTSGVRVSWLPSCSAEQWTHYGACQS